MIPQGRRRRMRGMGHTIAGSVTPRLGEVTL
jgi:hypothetical protein